jgi:hypothetical protein
MSINLTAMRIFISWIFMSLALLACQQPGEQAAGLLSPQKQSSPSTGEPEGDLLEAVPPQGTPKRLIKRGALRFESPDPAQTYARIQDLLTRYEAYLAQEEQATYGQRHQWELLIRVPAARFDSLVADIGEGVAFFEQRTLSVEDVTEQFIDLEIRQENKQALEGRYRQLLTQARSVEDILAIERQLAMVREEIEAAEGRLRYLRDQVGYATLEVVFYEDDVESIGFFTRGGQALGEGGNIFLDFLVGVLRLWPFWLLIGAVGWLWRRWRKRKRS